MLFDDKMDTISDVQSAIWEKMYSLSLLVTSSMAELPVLNVLACTECPEDTSKFNRVFNLGTFLNHISIKMKYDLKKKVPPAENLISLLC